MNPVGLSFFFSISDCTSEKNITLWIGSMAFMIGTR